MIYLGKNIPEFMMYSRTLIFGVKEDNFIQERLLPFKVDAERLNECEKIYFDAEKAESTKTKEFGEQLEAKEIFDRLFEEAGSLFEKHSDFLKLGLKYNGEKLRKLLSAIQPKSRKISQWIKQMLEFYDIVLGDNEIVDSVLRFGITREELESGRQKVVEADEAKQRHTRETGEARDATSVRDEAFRKLYDVVEELEVMCYYALVDRPQLLEKLGIQVLSPGYKRKKKDEKKEEGDVVAAGEGEGQEQEKEQLQEQPQDEKQVKQN